MFDAAVVTIFVETGAMVLTAAALGFGIWFVKKLL